MYSLGRCWHTWCNDRRPRMRAVTTRKRSTSSPRWSCPRQCLLSKLSDSGSQIQISRAVSERTASTWHSHPLGTGWPWRLVVASSSWRRRFARPSIPDRTRNAWRPLWHGRVYCAKISLRRWEQYLHMIQTDWIKNKNLTPIQKA